MTVTVLVEAPIKSGNLEKLKATLANAIPETRAKDGCQSVTANFDAEGKTLVLVQQWDSCLLYTSPSPRDGLLSRMPSSA